VRVVVDGFGSTPRWPRCAQLAGRQRRALEVFRPLDRWWSWLQPGPAAPPAPEAVRGRRREVAFVGGINVIDDRNDLHHGAASSRGWTSPSPCAARWWPAVHAPRRGDVDARPPGRGWRDEVRALVRSRRRWTRRCA
jgi:cardiolipin synthase